MYAIYLGLIYKFTIICESETQFNDVRTDIRVGTKSLMIRNIIPYAVRSDLMVFVTCILYRNIRRFNQI